MQPSRANRFIYCVAVAVSLWLHFHRRRRRSNDSKRERSTQANTRKRRQKKKEIKKRASNLWNDNNRKGLTKFIVSNSFYSSIFLFLFFARRMAFFSLVLFCKSKRKERCASKMKEMVKSERGKNANCIQIECFSRAVATGRNDSQTCDWGAGVSIQAIEPFAASVSTFCVAKTTVDLVRGCRLDCGGYMQTKLKSIDHSIWKPTKFTSTGPNVTNR